MGLKATKPIPTIYISESGATFRIYHLITNPCNKRLALDYMKGGVNHDIAYSIISSIVTSNQTKKITYKDKTS